MSLLELVREQEAHGVMEETPRIDVERRREQVDRLKHDLIERLGLDVVAKLVSSEELDRARTELSVTCRAILNSGAYEDVTTAEREDLVARALNDICGLGPLQGLLDDPMVTEVLINGTRGLFFERAGKIEAADAVFESSEQIMMVLDRILAPLGRRLDRASPLVNARLPNGDRVNAVAAPISIDGPAVSIRKFGNRIATMGRLVELGSLPEWFSLLLSWAVRMREDIAVAGGTGSGKTTLLNALSREIGVDERIITIEDSAELRFDAHPDVVRMEARDASIEGSGEITIRDLVKNSLRMRPDRIVVGEVRGAEAIDMLSAMSTGHSGSLTSLHSGTPQEAVLRLVLMVRFGMDLPTDVIETQIATALDFIVMGHRFPDGSRKITSLTRVSLREGGGVSLEECVSYNQTTGEWDMLCEPAFVQRGVDEGVLDAGEVERWRSHFA